MSKKHPDQEHFDESDFKDYPSLEEIAAVAPPDSSTPFGRWIATPIKEHIARWKREIAEGLRDTEGRRVSQRKKTSAAQWRIGDVLKIVVRDWLLSAQGVRRAMQGDAPALAFLGSAAQSEAIPVKRFSLV